MIEGYLPGDPDRHSECLTMGAALKYFVYCLWMKAVVNGNPSVLFRRFTLWQNRLMGPLLPRHPKDKRGWALPAALVWMGHVCVQPLCKAIGWLPGFCGQCGFGVEITKHRQPTLEQCYEYLGSHQELANMDPL